MSHGIALSLTSYEILANFLGLNLLVRMEYIEMVDIRAHSLHDGDDHGDGDDEEKPSRKVVFTGLGWCPWLAVVSRAPIWTQRTGVGALSPIIVGAPRSGWGLISV